LQDGGADGYRAPHERVQWKVHLLVNNAVVLLRGGAPMALMTRIVLFLLPGIAQVIYAQMPPPVGGLQWPSFNNRLDGQRFSLLREITAGNAAQLGEQCRVQIDGPGSFMAGLIVVDGVIYTNTWRETVALDASNCRVLWKHTVIPEDDDVSQSSRGPAVMDGRVFRGTGDGRLLALDAATGRLLWKNVIASPRVSEMLSGAPLAWQGVVYMGIGGSDRLASTVAYIKDPKLPMPKLFPDLLTEQNIVDVSAYLQQGIPR
jgi:glucose dehydrogenase